MRAKKTPLASFLQASLQKINATTTHAAAIGAVTLLSQTAFADGSVSGKLSDKSGSYGIEGALVTVKELNVQTSTNRDGRYNLPSLPNGEYTLELSYVGADTQTRAIAITDNAILVEHFTLSSNATEHVLVIGEAASLNKALNKQRASNNIVSIVNADAIGNYPDANTSEALQRLPGVSVENDQGEGRYVRIRGLGANFNSVTINGSKVPSPNAGERAVALDTVPSELLESLEVTKTLTPDMDADSLGGTINVKSLSAFDRDGRFYKATLETNFDEHTSQASPKLSLTASDLFSIGDGADNFGVAGALSWYERKFGSDNVETGGAWDFADNAADTRLEEFEQRDYTISRERLGASLNFDYQANDVTNLFLRTLYSEYTDAEERQANVIEMYQFERDDLGEIVLDDEGDEETNDGIPASETGAATIARELKDRTETMKIKSLVLGGKSEWDTWVIDYKLGASQSSEHTPFHIDGAVFEADFEEGIGYSAAKQIYLHAPAEVYAADSYELDEIATAQQITKDKENNIQLDITKRLQLAGNPLALKWGAKLSQREKTSDEEVWAYSDLDEVGFTDEQLLLSNYVATNSGEAQIDYQFGPMGQAIASSPLLNAISPLDKSEYHEEIDSAIADFTVNEDISAAYVMGTLDVDKLRILAGVRVEQTDFTAAGMHYNEYEAEGAEIEELTTASFNNDYSHTLPSLHLRYLIGEKVQLRAAWTNAVVRPTFEQLSPAKVREGDEVEFGNPLLKPLEASNLDIGIEYYGGFASYFSAFVFSKDIENFVYAIDLGATADASLVGPGEISEANTFKNGDSATLTGLELAASKQFSELPAPWDGFLVSANATWTSSEATIDYLDDELFAQRDIHLPSQSNFSGNFAIGYETEKFSLRVAANYKSEYLLEVSDPSDAKGDAWVDAQTGIDLLARWYASEKVQVFVQGVNLGDQGYYVYSGEGQKDYNFQYEEYGPSFRLGVTITDF